MYCSLVLSLALFSVDCESESEFGEDPFKSRLLEIFCDELVELTVVLSCCRLVTNDETVKGNEVDEGRMIKTGTLSNLVCYVFGVLFSASAFLIASMIVNPL